MDVLARASHDAGANGRHRALRCRPMAPHRTGIAARRNCHTLRGDTSPHTATDHSALEKQRWRKFMMGVMSELDVIIIHIRAEQAAEYERLFAERELPRWRD